MDKAIEIKRKIYIHPIDLGIFESENPTDDRKVHLEIDDAKISFNEKYIVINPTKWHFNFYEIEYCIECLKKGIKNKNWHCGGKNGYWCKDHYAQKMRKERPDLRCPECDEGYIMFCTCDMACSHCDHREAHRHSIADLQSPHFACTCGSIFIPQMGIHPISDKEH